MNSLLLTLTALLILVLSALFAAPLFIDWNDYRPTFEAQATKLLGRQVKVDGAVHLKLLPAPELKFDDVKVANEDGSLEQPFLEAKSLEARVDIGTLLTGAVEAHQIAIVDPTLRLELKADGSGNWRDIGQHGSLRGKTSAPFVPKDVLLDSVRISGGTIEIVKDGVRKFIFANIDGEASGASLAGPYKVSVAYDYGDRRQTIRFSTGGMDEQGKFRLKAALRDPDRSTTYQLDGIVAGIGAAPSYDGTLLMRMAGLDASAPPVEQGREVDASTQDGDASRSHNAQKSLDAQKPHDPQKSFSETASFVELKGPLKASPEGAELSEFDLTLHAAGRPQILKGSLAFDFRAPFKADGKLAARWIDLDAWFGTAGEDRPSPAAVLHMFAAWVLEEGARFGTSALHLDIDQAGIGGDIVGGLDLALESHDGGVTVSRLKATLPGGNKIALSGRLQPGQFGPLFTGPVEIDGSGLRAFTRWVSGDRAMTRKAPVGDFALSALATVGDGEVKLANAVGVVSDTKFGGKFHYRAGDTTLIDIELSSDRLDLREVLGGGPVWHAWLSGNGGETATPQQNARGESDTSLLEQLRDDNVHASLKVGELLLPNIPPGKLDAKLSLVDGTLDVQSLDFVAPGAAALSGKGSIASVADAPSGRVDLTLQAQTTESLRTLSDFFGFGEDVAQSKHLSALVPVDLHAELVASRDDDTTKASVELSGQVGGSDVALLAGVHGEPSALADAKIDLGGSVTGERPQALLVLLFPDLPQDRLEAAGTQGTLSLKLAGVPREKLEGRGALETGAMQLAFEGQGALKDDGMTLNGFASIATDDASLALPLLGIDPPPSAEGVPLTLSANVLKQAGTIDLESVKARIADEAIEGNAHFERDEARTKFDIVANGERLSLPGLLGILVAWERTAATEELLGSVASDAADVWPARGFALELLDGTQGDISLNARTLSLGAPFDVENAKLTASVNGEGLAIQALEGRLLGGDFIASGTLSPRGNGAALTAQADLKGAELKALSTAVVGKPLAEGPFDMTFDVQGEGLSPPGIVAGLSGKGALTLGKGSLTALTTEPLRKVAATSTSKGTKAEIDADIANIRGTLTKGAYAYPATTFGFDVSNGTLRLAPTTLEGASAEMGIEGYVELASLKLDSEWQIRLTGPDGTNVPPVDVVFTGPLDNASSIAPAVDTAAIESYLTIARLQEDVERLESLDVTGGAPRNDAKANEAAEQSAAEKSAAEAEAEAKAAAEQAARERAAAEAEAVAEAKAASEAKAAAEKAAAEQAAAEEAARKKAVAANAAAERAARERIEAQAREAAEQAAAEANAAVAPDALLPSADSTLPTNPNALTDDPIADILGSETVEAELGQGAEEAETTIEPAPRRRRRLLRRPNRPDDWKKNYNIFGGG